jgi:hypothetical protein
MKNNLITSTILASSLIFSNVTLADENSQPMKHWSVGAGTYVVTIAFDNSEDDSFGGGALSATYAFNDNFAIRGNLFSLEHEDFSDVELTGFEMLAYYGTGLATKGFKAYVGGGLYNESIEANYFDEDFTGVQISGGIGYNWESLSLDFSLGLRSTGDYEDIFDDGEEVSVASGALVLAYRF